LGHCRKIELGYEFAVLVESACFAVRFSFKAAKAVVSAADFHHPIFDFIVVCGEALPLRREYGGGRREKKDFFAYDFFHPFLEKTANGKLAVGRVQKIITKMTPPVFGLPLLYNWRLPDLWQGKQ
jgi:hypothetical protein